MRQVQSGPSSQRRASLPAGASSAQSGVKPRYSRTVVVERQREKDRLAALIAKREAPLVVTSPARRAQLLACCSDMPGNSAGTQADRLMRALCSGPCTTFEARHYLEIMSPASRVYSLIHDDGCEIQMRLVKQESARGVEHTIAQYQLIRA